MIEIHPTILVGYGEYGEGVLRRLLLDASDRGTLPWEEANAGTRRLKKLSFLHVRDTLERRAEENRFTEVTDRFEMMRDLFNQIVEVDPDPDGISEKIEEMQRVLLGSPNSGDAVGLDVLILANPSRFESLGGLVTLFQPAMRRLSSERTLAGVHGQELLSFTLLLDFESYWRDSRECLDIREALRNLLLQQEENRKERKEPGFGRIYLFDGYVRAEYRDARKRLEEVVLFLEFSLFEGQRHSEELQPFFRRHPDDGSVLSSVGIRTIEHNTGLLVRLASAAFSIKWLQYLIRSTRSPLWQKDASLPSGNEESVLTKEMAQFFPARLADTLGQEDFRQWTDKALQDLESKLMEGHDGERWIERVRQESDRRRFLLKNEAASVVRNMLRDAVGKKFQSLSTNLDNAVSRSLHDETAGPRTIGSLLVELDQIETEMEGAIPVRQTGHLEDSADAFKELERSHREFLWFRGGLLQTERFRQWWPWLAIICALGFLPIAMEAIGEISPPDPASTAFARHTYTALHWLGTQGWLLALFAVGLVWTTGHHGFHKAVAKRVESALNFYTDADRGRLIARIRGWLRSDAFRGDLERHTERAYTGLLKGFLVRARHEVRRVRTLLDLRLHEVEWLRGQLGKYLDRFGITIDEAESLPSFRTERLARPFRDSTETNEDLRRIARRVPSDDGYFAAYQSRHEWFSGWNQTYCDTFLHPLSFLDRIRGEFNPAHRDDALESALKDDSIKKACQQVTPGFQWLSSEAPDTRSFCVLPPQWFQLDRIKLQLKEEGFDQLIPSKTNDRVYFLRLQTGIAISNLMRVER